MNVNAVSYQRQFEKITVPLVFSSETFNIFRPSDVGKSFLSNRGLSGRLGLTSGESANVYSIALVFNFIMSQI